MGPGRVWASNEAPSEEALGRAWDWEFCCIRLGKIRFKFATTITAIMLKILFFPANAKHFKFLVENQIILFTYVTLEIF